MNDVDDERKKFDEGSGLRLVFSLRDFPKTVFFSNGGDPHRSGE